MCDQNEVRILEASPYISCSQENDENYPSQEQYDDTEACMNCEDDKFCRPECNKCPPPTPSCNPCDYPNEFCYDPCNPCMPRCDPCEPLSPTQMPLDYCCEPRRPCPPLDCNGPLCSPYNRGYRQPPRRESFKPVSKYQRPLIPMTTDTVYRKSFECVDSQITACCRPPPYVPNGQLQLPCGGFAKDTITRMSFQQACQPERVRPFNPKTSFTFGCGELQKLTTQKHDFVPKFQCKQPMSVPRNNIGNCCGRMENGTVQKLSFQHPCVFTRTQSCKPIIRYKQPELPMECETTQKLSFQPVCPPPKEDYPWARKARYCPPEVKFARDTVAKLSYQPPGCFIDENKICCEMPCEEYPKASC